MTNKGELILPIAAQGAGKTHLRERLKEEYGDKLVIVSPDDIRVEMREDEEVNTPEHNNKVFEMTDKMMMKALGEGKIVYYDGTNAHEEYRRGLIKRARERFPETKISSYFFDVDLETILDRNNEREGFANVPEWVIVNTYLRIMKDEKIWDGFNEMNIVDKDGLIERKDFDEFKNFFADNIIKNKEIIEKISGISEILEDIRVLEGELKKMKDDEEELKGELKEGLKEELKELKKERDVIVEDLKNFYKETEKMSEFEGMK